MARILGLLPPALTAARGGMGATAFERYLRDIGLGARSSEVRALYKAAVDIVAKGQTEPFADIEAIPSGNEIAVWPSRLATGYKQTVQILYRDRTTGEIVTTYYNVTGDNLITRQAAIETAISVYSDNAERYNQDLIGGVSVGTYQMVPTGV